MATTELDEEQYTSEYGALGALTFAYFRQPWIMIAIPVLGYFMPVAAEVKTFNTYLYNMVYATAGFYALPFALSVFYMIFSDGFILFRWIDNALILIIEHYVSNGTPLLMLAVIYNTVQIFQAISSEDEKEWESLSYLAFTIIGIF